MHRIMFFISNFPSFQHGRKRYVKLTAGLIRHAIYIVAYTANITSLLIGWLTDWLTDRLTDLLTDLLTDWLTDWLFDWLTETVMGRLVDCCWPILLNLQANVLMMWVLPVLCHFFLTNWWCGWLIDDQFRPSLPIMTKWIQGQPGWIVKLADWVSHQLTDQLIDWFSGELANWEIDSWFRAGWKAYWPIHCLNVFIGSIFL